MCLIGLLAISGRPGRAPASPAQPHDAIQLAVLHWFEMQNSLKAKSIGLVPVSTPMEFIPEPREPPRNLYLSPAPPGGSRGSGINGLRYSALRTVTELSENQIIDLPR